MAFKKKTITLLSVILQPYTKNLKSTQPMKMVDSLANQTPILVTNKTIESCIGNSNFN